jgi:dUTP pyrophosphatase
MRIDVRIQYLSEKLGREISPPRYATEGAAGMDISACLDGPLCLKAGARALVPTGFSIALPSNEYVAYIYARSGLGAKHGVTLPNCVGVIDSDYRGEVKIALVNYGNEDYTIAPGERVAQLVFAPVFRANLRLSAQLPETERGSGGFGSTGKAE